MKSVPIANSSPNMDLSVFVESYAYTFEFRTFRNLTYLTIKDMSDNVVTGNIRCCDREWLIHAQARNYVGAGNFRFECVNGQYPYFEDFGDTCKLMYYSQDELETET